MIVGYARTSTVDQVAGFEGQFKELSAAGCEKIFREQVSSITLRVQLQLALEFVREGDVFVVTKLDRLARSVADLMAILQALERKRVAMRILNLGMDTQTPTGKLMLTVLGGVAQYAEPAVMRSRELYPGQNTARYLKVSNVMFGLALRIIPAPSARKNQGPPEKVTPRLKAKQPNPCCRTSPQSLIR